MKMFKFSQHDMNNALALLGQSKVLSSYVEPIILGVAQDRMTPLMKQAVWVLKLEALQRQVLEGAQLLGLKTKGQHWPSLKNIQRQYDKFCSEFYPDVVADEALKAEREKIFHAGQAVYDFLMGPKGIYTVIDQMQILGLSFDDLMKSDPDDFKKKMIAFAQQIDPVVKNAATSVLAFYQDMTACIAQAPGIAKTSKKTAYERFDGFTADLVKNKKIEDLMMGLLTTMNFYVNSLNKLVKDLPHTLKASQHAFKRSTSLLKQKITTWSPAQKSSKKASTKEQKSVKMTREKAPLLLKEATSSVVTKNIKKPKV